MKKNIDNKIAIINFSEFRLGDILINRNFYRSICKHHNKDLVIFSKKICPIQDVLKFDNLKFISLRNDFSKGLKQISDYLKFLKQIKDNNIDTVYILDNNLRPTLFSFFSKIKKIYGLGFGIQKYFLTNKQYLNKNLINKNKHYIYEKFLEIMNIPFIEEAININKSNKIKKNNQVFINLDSSSKLKNWGDNNFFELIKKINSISKKTFFINCLNYESILFDKLKKENISHVDVSHLNIIDLFICINQCDFTVSNDTGPSHISMSLQKNTFVIFLENNKFNYNYSKFMHSIVVDEKNGINNVFKKINKIIFQLK